MNIVQFTLLFVSIVATVHQILSLISVNGAWGQMAATGSTEITLKYSWWLGILTSAFIQSIFVLSIMGPK